MHLLKYTNAYKEAFYFCNFGQQWGHNPARRLIERTSPDVEHARRFDSEEAAREALVVAGSPAGWEVVPCALLRANGVEVEFT